MRWSKCLKSSILTDEGQEDGMKEKRQRNVEKKGNWEGTEWRAIACRTKILHCYSINQSINQTSGFPAKSAESRYFQFMYVCVYQCFWISCGTLCSHWIRNNLYLTHFYYDVTLTPRNSTAIRPPLDSYSAPCGLRDCKKRPAPFPGRMSYKVTKPGSVWSVS